MAGQRGGGDGGRAAKVDLGGWITHAPGEVAVHGCKRSLSGGEDAKVTTDAGSTARSAN